MSVFLLPHAEISVRPKLSVFTIINPQIRSIAAHILNTGLLNPIIVRLTSKPGKAATSRYEIVDGFKRFNAILFLKRTGHLPRSLTSIPCITDDMKTVHRAIPIMLSESELSREITRRIALGATKQTLTAQYECTPCVFDQIVSLAFLHPKIKACFDDGHLSLEQAAAFATFPNPEAQWRLMEQLGPFVNSKTILSQLSAQTPFIELPDGDVLILPSRRQQELPNYTSSAARIAA